MFCKAWPIRLSLPCVCPMQIQFAIEWRLKQIWKGIREGRVTDDLSSFNLLVLCRWPFGSSLPRYPHLQRRRMNFEELQSVYSGRFLLGKPTLIIWMISIESIRWMMIESGGWSLFQPIVILNLCSGNSQNKIYVMIDFHSRILWSTKCQINFHLDLTVHLTNGIPPVLWHLLHTFIVRFQDPFSRFPFDFVFNVENFPDWFLHWTLAIYCRRSAFPPPQFNYCRRRVASSR